MTNIDVVRRICRELTSSRLLPDSTARAMITYVETAPTSALRHRCFQDRFRARLASAMTFAEGIRRHVQWYLANTRGRSKRQSGEYRNWIAANYERKERVNRKGIILAGGSGTRLHPITQAVSKQLLPIYDKPMIYYPLSTLMLAGITRDPRHIDARGHPAVRAPARRRKRWGSSCVMRAALARTGLRSAFIVGEEFIGGETRARPRDNIFYGHDSPWIYACPCATAGATVFAYAVQDPERYGVVEFDAEGRALSLEEKPVQPEMRGNAVTGLLLLTTRVVEMASRSSRRRAASWRSPTSTGSTSTGAT